MAAIQHKLKQLLNNKISIFKVVSVAASTSNQVTQSLLNEHNESFGNCTVLCGSFNPLHQGHIKLLQSAHQLSKKPQMCFEMTVKNADKGQIDEKSVLDRIDQFQLRGLPLVVTNQPLFLTKAKLMPNSCFVVGYDTFVRLVDTKYYGDSLEKMKEALQELKDLGISFVVGGRAEKNEFKELTKDVLEQLVPIEFQQMFIGLPGFRLDISSTELRRQRAKL